MQLTFFILNISGQTEEQQPVVPASRPTYSVGDVVKVCLEKEALMKLQQGHGGWNPRMAEYLIKIGTVHRITDKGDIRLVILSFFKSVRLDSHKILAAAALGLVHRLRTVNSIRYSL